MPSWCGSRSGGETWSCAPRSVAPPVCHSGLSAMASRSPSLIQESGQGSRMLTPILCRPSDAYPSKTSGFVRIDKQSSVDPRGSEPAVQVNAKVDYALRALAELAVADPRPMKAEGNSRAQGIPPKFLENILLELRHAGIVLSQR